MTSQMTSKIALNSHKKCTFLNIYALIFIHINCFQQKLPKLKNKYRIFYE